MSRYSNMWMIPVALLLGSLIAILGMAGLPAVVYVSALPLLVVLGLKYPELLLAAFLLSGSVALGSAPVLDIGFGLGIVVLVVCVVRLSSDGAVGVPAGVTLTVACALLVAVGVSYSSFPVYGMEKALRFGSLGVLSMTAPLVLIRSRESLRRFVFAILVVGLALGVSGLAMGLVSGATRIQTFAGSPITLARIAGLALAAAVALGHSNGRLRSFVTPAATILLLWVLIGTGSRGPAAALIVAASTVAVGRLVNGGASRVRLAGSVLISLALLAAVIYLSPDSTLGRYQLLLDANPGESALARPLLLSRALQLGVDNPWTGVGTGSFATEIGGLYYFQPLRYPHNLFAEVFSENGLFAAALMISGVALGMIAAWKRALSSATEVEWFLLFAVVFTLVNAMVSGDLNDNQMLFALLAIAGSSSTFTDEPAGASL